MEENEKEQKNESPKVSKFTKIITYFKKCSKRYVKENNIENRVQEKIAEKELSISKKEPIIKMFRNLNKENTIIAVHGEQGSGKSEVIKTAMDDLFLPKKSVWNFICIILWWFVLIITSLLLIGLYHPIREAILKRISRRRWRKINLNIWNIFGHRESQEYIGINRTAFLYKSKDKDGVIHDEIKSFMAQFIINKDSSQVEELVIDDQVVYESDKASWTFIKKAIWRTIFSKFKRRNPFIPKLKSSIFNNSYSEQKQKIKIKYIIIDVFIWLFITILVWATFFGIAYFFIEELGPIYSNVDSPGWSAIISGPMAFPLGFIIKKYMVSKMDTLHSKRDNDFFVDPISNTGIEKYIKKLTKNKLTIIYVSELDRFKTWLKSNSGVDTENNSNGESKNDSIDKLINFIIESITLGYQGSNNMNIVFEIAPNIQESITSMRLGEIDKKKKHFPEIIQVNKMKADELIQFAKIKGIKIPRINKYLMNHLIALAHSDVFDNKAFDSWRHLDEIINVYNASVMNLPDELWRKESANLSNENNTNPFIPKQDYWKYLFLNKINEEFEVKPKLDEETKIFPSKRQISLNKLLDEEEIKDMVFNLAALDYPNIHYGGTLYKNRLNLDEYINELFKNNNISTNVSEVNVWPLKYCIVNATSEQLNKFLDTREFDNNSLWNLTWTDMPKITSAKSIFNKLSNDNKARMLLTMTSADVIHHRTLLNEIDYKGIVNQHSLSVQIDFLTKVRQITEKELMEFILKSNEVNNIRTWVINKKAESTEFIQNFFDEYLLLTKPQQVKVCKKLFGNKKIIKHKLTFEKNIISFINKKPNTQ